MKIQICKTCNLEKDLNDFYFKKIKNRYDYECKYCHLLKKKFYYLNNIDKLKNKRKNHYQNNKENIKQKRKEYIFKNLNKINELKQKYYQENKLNIKKQRKIYYQKNKNNIKIQKKQYRENNKNKISLNLLKYKNKEKTSNQKNKIKIRKKQYFANKYNNDFSFKIKSLVSEAIRQCLKSNNSSKNNQKCSEYLSYSFETLKIHIIKTFSNIENLHNNKVWMNLKNHGSYNLKTWNDDDSSTWSWNIDHIIPQSDLPYTSMDDENFKLCWDISNLRAYSAKQNILDGAKRTRHNK